MPCNTRNWYTRFVHIYIVSKYKYTITLVILLRWECAVREGHWFGQLKVWVCTYIRRVSLCKFKQNFFLGKCVCMCVCFWNGVLFQQPIIHTVMDMTYPTGHTVPSVCMNQTFLLAKSSLFYSGFPHNTWHLVVCSVDTYVHVRNDNLEPYAPLLVCSCALCMCVPMEHVHVTYTP